LCPRRYPVRPIKFPISWRTELAQKVPHYSVFLPRVESPSRQNRQIPCRIPCLQGICPETGAISTASPAAHSGVQPSFPRDARMGRKSRLFAYSLSSLDSAFAEVEAEIAKSLRPSPQIFPFWRDYGQRLVRSRLPPEGGGHLCALIRFLTNVYRSSIGP
jgi:hypothetical protein